MLICFKMLTAMSKKYNDILYCQHVAHKLNFALTVASDSTSRLQVMHSHQTLLFFCQNTKTKEK